MKGSYVTPKVSLKLAAVEEGFSLSMPPHCEHSNGIVCGMDGQINDHYYHEFNNPNSGGGNMEPLDDIGTWDI